METVPNPHKLVGFCTTFAFVTVKWACYFYWLKRCYSSHKSALAAAENHFAHHLVILRLSLHHNFR